MKIIDKLRKGVARRLYGKFNPRDDEYAPDVEALQDWQGIYSVPEGRERAFSQKTSQTKNERLRTFNKLHGKTQVRRNPNTQEREFLLHRGTGFIEKNKSVKGGTVNQNFTTSWTPHLSVAKAHADVGDGGGVISAWIPESKIKGSVHQLKPGDKYHTGHEILVHPGHNSEIYNPKLTKSDDSSLEDRIRTKLKIPKEIKALQKSGDNSNKLILDKNVHGHSTYKDHSDLIHGVDANENLMPGIANTTKELHVASKPSGGHVVLKAPLSLDEHAFWLGYDPEERESLKPHSLFGNPDFQTTHREATFSRLAGNVFGLGEYVPKTTAFNNPRDGKVWSAQEFIPSEGYKDPSQLNQSSSKDLHKLAIMETILGHQDRNKSNIRVDAVGRPHLIDNALSFDYSGLYGADHPAYADHLLRMPVPSDVHKWIHGLDEHRLVSEMSQMGAPRQTIEQTKDRLAEVKSWSNRLRANPSWNGDLGSGLALTRMHKMYPAGTDFDKKLAIKAGYGTISRGKSLVDEEPTDSLRTTKKEM